MAIELTINGTRHQIEAAPGTPLLWILRDRLGMTGTKYGCGVAQCGACTVHLNGQPRRACVLPVEAAAGAEITTIEGAEGRVADAVRKAWQAIDVPQCGYCQSGQIMSAISLLQVLSNPSDEDIDQGMSGNLCRCATYVRIRRAIKDAAKELTS
ncbi:(2Fe-2S)-binding protein [Pseudomarimonas salicorniae]|uniref:(2Fe-2S)-binding protein n=1 Tax=Pseudomarimonas salicorniae TaxID=2933270 RepID=A0ABT0GCQ3_9GAMM|nr:(2Fe-2S)-binding protein [Lysobacter sp. CAU 1642]MCK7592306.1 (2Fe-2S)-binding protein [Lysobacter sp. CAU 1642]